MLFSSAGSSTEIVASGLFMAGAAGLALSLPWLASRVEPNPAGPSTPEKFSFDGNRQTWILLAFIVVVAMGVRIQGLDLKGLSHPEIYIPGLDLPPNISEPEPRHGFLHTLRWHFFSEPHPFGYYMAMWAWTALFGATETSIRMPPAILGALSIPLVFRIGQLVYNRNVGLIAAAMLALHGFHIFWSQSARMYVPGTFFGLLATVFLLEAATKPQSPHLRWIMIGYVFSIMAGVATVEFAWVLLATHIAWIVVHPRHTPGQVNQLGRVMAAAAICSAPMISHAVISARRGMAPAPSLEFLEKYFSFGFLYQHGGYAEPITGPVPVFQLLMFLASTGLIAFGLFRKGRSAPSRELEPRPALGLIALVPAALAASMVMGGFALVSMKHRLLMFAVLFLPWMGLALPALLSRLAHTNRRMNWGALDPLMATVTGLVPLLAIASTGVVFLVSYYVPMMAPRAFCIFIPYLVLMIAAGLNLLLDRLLDGRRAAGVGLLLLLLGLFVGSVVQARRTPNSPRDYKGLAMAMRAEMRPDDIISAPAHSWRMTPIFFYLPQKQLDTSDLKLSLRRHPSARVWAMYMDDDAVRYQPKKAIRGFKVVKRVRADAANAELRVPSI